jgi:hypothetical protein
MPHVYWLELAHFVAATTKHSAANKADRSLPEEFPTSGSPGAEANHFCKAG